MLKTRIIPALLTAALFLPAMLSPDHAAAGEEVEIEDVDFSFEGPFGTYEKFQLQRGFQVFQQVCAACHGLKFVAFRDLGSETGPGFPAEQVKAIAELYEVVDEEGEPGDTRAGKPFDKFPENTAAGAPDLSLMAKARVGFRGPYGTGLSQLINGMGGPEYIYSFLTGFTGEESEQAGSTIYENRAFAAQFSIMPPPLSEGLVEYEVFGEAGEEGGYVPPEPTVEQMAEDVSAFLMWTAEPKMVERKKAGFRNILMLLLLAVLLYFTNKTLWARVKRKE
jgi:ubiquinol-cytochrome c reductase cytochrome c1 subunit